MVAVSPVCIGSAIVCRSRSVVPRSGCRLIDRAPITTKAPPPTTAASNLSCSGDQGRCGVESACPRIPRESVCAQRNAAFLVDVAGGQFDGNSVGVICACARNSSRVERQMRASGISVRPCPAASAGGQRSDPPHHTQSVAADHQSRPTPTAAAAPADSERADCRSCRPRGTAGRVALRGRRAGSPLAAALARLSGMLAGLLFANYRSQVEGYHFRVIAMAASGHCRLPVTVGYPPEPSAAWMRTGMCDRSAGCGCRVSCWGSLLAGFVLTEGCWSPCASMGADSYRDSSRLT